MGAPRERQMGQRRRPPEQLLQAHMWPQEGKTVSEGRSKQTTHSPRPPTSPSAPPPPPAAASCPPLADATGTELPVQGGLHAEGDFLQMSGDRL